MKKAYSSGNENVVIKPRTVASKNPAVNALQDLLFYQLTGIGFFAKANMELKKNDKTTDNKLSRLLYLCNKNINFNITILEEALKETIILKNREANLYNLIHKNNNIRKKTLSDAAKIQIASSISKMVSQANIINAQKSIKISNINIFAMYEIIKEALCSSANSLERIKEHETLPQNIYNSIYNILEFLSKNSNNINEYTNFALKAGELHTQTLELLIASLEKTYGLIEQRNVSTNYKKGNAILVAGEDFTFLKQLLEQTQKKSINIYTYGNMNYAHAFPELYKYKNLAGIYIGKYGDLAANLETFPGIVILTTGNLEDLSDIYRGRIFTTEDISMLGIQKINKDNLQTIINAAYDADGFENNVEYPSIKIGFGLKELEEYTNIFVAKLKTKTTNKVFIFLGCDYFENEKNYFTNLMKKQSKNTLFLILDCLFTCHKKNYKNNPTIMHIGQYINLYNFVRLLFATAGKFKKDINNMPFYLIINLKSPDTISSLLMLLSLGIQNIQINSDLPNYITECLINNFQKTYNIFKLENFDNDFLSNNYQKKKNL